MLYFIELEELSSQIQCFDQNAMANEVLCFNAPRMPIAYKNRSTALGK